MVQEVQILIAKHQGSPQERGPLPWTGMRKGLLRERQKKAEIRVLLQIC